jgi:hypothetical protein
MFSPEACSFYDFMRSINDILAMGIAANPLLGTRLIRISCFISFVVLRLLRSFSTSLILSIARTLMYQFRRQDMALQAARLLAVRQPIVVMVRGLMDLFTIGPITHAAVHVAGRHMATVYRSGRVRYNGLA